MSDDDLFASGGAILGALAAGAYGFTQAGIGGVLVGLLLGSIAGAFSGLLVITVLPLGIIIGILAAVIWVVNALWGVGKP